MFGTLEFPVISPKRPSVHRSTRCAPLPSTTCTICKRYSFSSSMSGYRLPVGHSSDYSTNDVTSLRHTSQLGRSSLPPRDPVRARRGLVLYLGLRLSIRLLSRGLGRSDNERNDGADEHEPGRDIEGEVIRAGCVRGHRQD